MEHIKFAVDQKPYCLWGYDLAEANLNLIDSIDPGYFRYLVDIYAQALGSDEHQHHAALSLRTAYLHGLETLFAVLLAAVQAPDCVIGWLHKYETSDLPHLLTNIKKGQPVLSKLRMERVTWREVSSAIFANVEDRQIQADVIECYAAAWERLADDLLLDDNRNEYNSVKHGLRLRSGGFTLAVGREDGSGAPAPRDRMWSVGGSPFGTTFSVLNQIDHSKQHFFMEERSRNWRPENFLYGLQLISFSLHNIRLFLKIFNGVDPASAGSPIRPSQESDFQAPWKLECSVSQFDTAPVMPNGIRLFSRDEILAVYSTEPGG